MISLTRLRGQEVAINPDLIEIVEESPDTTVRLLSGDRIVVKESITEIIERVIEYRRALMEAFSTHPARPLSRPPVPVR